MKVTGSTSAPKTGAAAPTRPSAGGFTLPNIAAAAETAAPARAASIGGVSSVQALIALQEMGGPLERRKKAMERGGRLLDGGTDRGTRSRSCFQSRYGWGSCRTAGGARRKACSYQSLYILAAVPGGR